METQLVEVRCPFKVTSKKGFVYNCNRLCVRVSSGSEGEAYCWSCKLKFWYEIDGYSKFSSKIKAQPKVKALNAKK